MTLSPSTETWMFGLPRPTLATCSFSDSAACASCPVSVSHSFSPASFTNAKIPIFGSPFTVTVASGRRNPDPRLAKSRLQKPAKYPQAPSSPHNTAPIRVKIRRHPRHGSADGHQATEIPLRPRRNPPLRPGRRALPRHPADPVHAPAQPGGRTRPGTGATQPALRRLHRGRRARTGLGTQPAGGPGRAVRGSRRLPRSSWSGPCAWAWCRWPASTRCAWSSTWPGATRSCVSSSIP